MFESIGNSGQSAIDTLCVRGYAPAEAANCLREGKYSRAVEICREYLTEHAHAASVRLTYARSLFHAGQIETATDQFYEILMQDPDSVVALKYLGDIKYQQKDEFGALALYARVLEIDPGSKILQCRLEKKDKEITRTLTISHAPETTSHTRPAPTRTIHFYTETIADLYLSQGYPRLAAEVYQRLFDENPTGRFKEKLSQAEERIKEKESAHVKKTD
ncbi:MAG TPA: tetratricopeptide repeat protein [candidate division Zixibacteria bacterium]|nr:tetratricopeptide repeat protein [candidate division Zixibacteria bacterium]